MTQIILLAALLDCHLPLLGHREWRVREAAQRFLVRTESVGVLRCGLLDSDAEIRLRSHKAFFDLIPCKPYPWLYLGGYGSDETNYWYSRTDLGLVTDDRYRDACHLWVAEQLRIGVSVYLVRRDLRLMRQIEHRWHFKEQAPSLLRLFPMW